MYRLIIRNILLNFRRELPIVFIFTLAIAFLYVGNAILERVNSSFQESYVDSISGDFSISQKAEFQYSLFGSESILAGNYEEIPIILDQDAIEDALSSNKAVADYTNLLSGVSQVEILGQKVNQPFFGVEFEDYKTFFPGLNLIVGSFPGNFDKGIVITETRYEAIREHTGFYPEVGEPVLLSAANNRSFTIREVPLRGVIRYPVSNPLLERIVLIDFQTARSLKNYLYVNNADTLLDPSESEFLGSDLDSLFTLTGETSSETKAEVDPLALFDDLAFLSFDDVPVESSEGAWNFILIKADSEFSRSELANNLPVDVQVSDWRETVGGNTRLIYFLQIILNVGLVVIALGAIVILINSLSLFVLERTKEIGTMRAIGASKLTVCGLIGGESVGIIVLSGVLGVVIGNLFIEILNGLSITVPNQFISNLLGGNELSGANTPELVLAYLILIVLTGFLALIYPLSRALKISPLKAMSEE